MKLNLIFISTELVIIVFGYPQLSNSSLELQLKTFIK